MSKVRFVLMGLIAGFSIAATKVPPPVITIMPRPPLSETYGDWTVTSVSASTYMATTQNNAGSVFGAICDVSECLAMFNPKISCENGNSYPALINAPSAAYPMILKCEKLDDVFVYSTAIAGSIADAMSVGGVLGIAFPMQSGEFKVARFSLTGSARAVARASQLAKASAAPAPRTPTDNSTL